MKDIELDNSSLTIQSISDNLFTKLEKFTYTYDLVAQFFIAEFDKPFRLGHNYTFSVQYKGQTKSDDIGLYRSYYFDSSNNKR